MNDDDCFVVKLFAFIFGFGWAITAIPAIWGIWVPFIAGGIAFTLALVAVVCAVVLYN